MTTENLYAPHASREAWLTHLREVAAIAADRTLFDSIQAEANIFQARLDAAPQRSEAFVEARRAEREARDV